MKIQYEAKIIRAKLRSYRFRTALVIVVSSILFGLLVAGAIMYRGVVASIDIFGNEGYHRQHMVTASTTTIRAGMSTDLNLIDRAEEIQEELIAKKEALAKKYDIPYDKKQEDPVTIEQINGNKKVKALNYRSKAVAKAILERNAKILKTSEPDLRNIVEKYGVKVVYPSDNRYAADGSISLLKDGKELLLEKSGQNDALQTQIMRGQSVVNTVNILDDTLTQPFILPDADMESTESIPLIVSYDTAERILGLAPLKKDNSPSEYVARMQVVQASIVKKTFSACYRNNASIERIQTSQREKDRQIKQNNVAYKAPSVPCGSAIIAEDKRTEADKKREKNTKLYNSELGIERNPSEKMLQYRIVGLFPYSKQSSPSENANELIRQILSGDGGGYPTIPLSLYQKPQLKEIVDAHYGEPRGMESLFATREFTMIFSDFDTAKKMIDTEACTVDSSGICKGKTNFQMALSGNNDAAVADAMSIMNRVIIYGALVVTALAVLFMWILLGKIIADSRKETAVLRAVGYSRRNIASIYVTYTLYMSLVTVLLSVGIGIAGAYFVDTTYTQRVTDFALYSIGAIDLTRMATLMHINWFDILIITVLIVSTGLLATIVPLIRNIRRNPIDDLREV